MTATPPESPSQGRQQSPHNEFSQTISSPPGDTQALSQFVYPPRAFADDEDEDAEGVWGYLLPLDDKVNGAFVLKQRNGCSGREEQSQDKPGKKPDSRKEAANNRAPGGYLVGRHPECGEYSLASRQLIYLLTLPQI